MALPVERLIGRRTGGRR